MLVRVRSRASSIASLRSNILKLFAARGYNVYHNVHGSHCDKSQQGHEHHVVKKWCNVHLCCSSQALDGYTHIGNASVLQVAVAIVGIIHRSAQRIRPADGQALNVAQFEAKHRPQERRGEATCTAGGIVNKQ